LATDDSGQYAMFGSNITLGGKVSARKTGDSFSTWENIMNFPTDFYQIVSGAKKPFHCFDGNQWAVAGQFLAADYLNTQNSVLFTSDFGYTWESRMGNLGSYLATGTADGYNFDMIVSWDR
jgi:hypothetical protein